MSNNDKGPSTNTLIWATIALIVILLCFALAIKPKASVSLCLNCPQHPGTVAGIEVGVMGHMHSLDVHTSAATGTPGLNAGVWRDGWAPESGRWIFLEIQ